MRTVKTQGSGGVVPFLILISFLPTLVFGSVTPDDLKSGFIGDYSQQKDNLLLAQQTSIVHSEEQPANLSQADAIEDVAVKPSFGKRLIKGVGWTLSVPLRVAGTVFSVGFLSLVFFGFESPREFFEFNKEMIDMIWGVKDKD